MIADMANAYMILEAFAALTKGELDGIGFMHGQAVANEALGDVGDADEWVRMEEIRMDGLQGVPRQCALIVVFRVMVHSFLRGLAQGTNSNSQRLH